MRVGIPEFTIFMRLDGRNSMEVFTGRNYP
jgi:hypothetical protein